MTKQLTADILFLAQIGLALVFGGSEFLRLLNTSQGIPIFWLASWLAFLLINLVLTIRAYVSCPSRVTLQAVGCYALWTRDHRLGPGSTVHEGHGHLARR